jgi:hypothetical protein
MICAGFSLAAQDCHDPQRNRVPGSLKEIGRLAKLARRRPIETTYVNSDRVRVSICRARYMLVDTASRPGMSGPPLIRSQPPLRGERYPTSAIVEGRLRLGVPLGTLFSK